LRSGQSFCQKPIFHGLGIGLGFQVSTCLWFLRVFSTGSGLCLVFLRIVFQQDLDVFVFLRTVFQEDLDALVFLRIVFQQDLDVLVSGQLDWLVFFRMQDQAFVQVVFWFSTQVLDSDGFRTIGLFSEVSDSTDPCWVGRTLVFRTGIGSLTELDLKRLYRNWIRRKLTDQAINTIS